MKLLHAAVSCALLAAPRLAADGPGLGNLSYAPGEVLTTLARFDHASGAPYGHGFVAMHRGYLVVPFALDAGGGLGSGGFAFYDVSDPRSVQRTFTTAGNPAYAAGGPNDPGDLGEPHGYSFTRFGGRDYVCFTQNIVAPNASGLQVWDFTEMDTPAPSKVSQIGLPGLNGGDYAPRAWWVFWQGGRYAYVAGSSAGLFVVDLSNPANPSLVASRSTAQLGFGTDATNVVFAIGNLLVVTGSQPFDTPTPSGLATYDISDPANPVLLDHVDELAGYSSMVNGSRIYGARDPARVWSIADPANITTVATGPDVAGKGGYGTVQDDFFLYGSSSRYVKLRTASTPFTVGHTHAPGGFTNPDWDFAVALGNLVFLGNDHSGSTLVAHQAEPDTTGPAVNMVSPAPDSLQRALSSRVGLTFTDAIDLRSVDSGSVIIRPVGGAALPGRYSHQTGIVNFWPDQPLQADTVYQVHLPAGGVKDYAGNGLESDFTSYFSTGGSLASVTVTAQSAGPVLLGGGTEFTATGSGEGTLEYPWDFGDGSPPTPFSNNSAAAHTYSAPGHFAVTVHVRNGVRQNSASFIQTVHRPPTAAAPAASTTILHDAGRVWCVNPDADTVSAIDAASLSLLLEVPVGRHPRTLARAPGGDIWVVNQEDATISVVNAAGAVVNTHPLPWASRPYGIAFSPDGSAAWVATEGSGHLLKLDPLTGALLGSVAPGGPLRGIAISGDSARVFVSRFLSPDEQGEVHEIDPGTLELVRTFGLAPDPGTDTESSGRGLPNYLGAAAISPDGQRLWLPSKKDNIARGLSRDGLPLTFESTVRTVVSQLDLAANAEVAAARVDFNDRDMAQAVAFSPLGDYAFVALQGSNAIEVLDAYSGTLVAAIENVGRAPQGLALDPDGSRLFVQNFMDRSIAVFDIADLTASRSSAAPQLGTIVTVANEALAADVLAGKRIFYDATDRRMNHDGYLSCASCHLDGGHDGRVWDFTDRGEGLRNTITLHGRAGSGHGRVHWTGNFDEIQDFEHDLRQAFGGDGFLTDAQFHTGTRDQPLGDPKAGLSSDLDALAAYVTSLATIHPSPHRDPAGDLTDQALAGRRHFADLGCYACHAGASFTDSPAGLLHRPGNPPGGRDTPTLKGVWETAPYLHDGSAATLLDALSNGPHGGSDRLTPAERGELVAYLLQLDDSESTYDFGPVAMLTEPVAGALYAAGGTIPLAVEVGGLLGGVSKVEFFRGQEKLGEAAAPPFAMTYPGAAAGTHDFHAVVHFLSGHRLATAAVQVTARSALPLPAVRVNFQPAGAPVPDGYLADSGEVFGDRGNGYSYGWNAPTTVTRDRNSANSPDQRHDTLNHLQNAVNPDAVWEIALPAGTYGVHIVSGDPINTSGNFFTTAEGMLVVNGSATSAVRWIEGTENVVVSDGRLTVRSAPGATNNKICFIDITPQSPAASGATVSLASITPATAEGAGTPGLVRLTRGGNPAAALAVRLAASGSARPGRDFLPLPSIATFAAGATTLDLPVVALADDDAEGVESITISLLDDPDYGAGANSTATVRITDHPYDDWRFRRFQPLDRIDESVSGFESDPFQRGVANGLAYALGLDPATASPAMSVQGIQHEGRFALQFTRPSGLGGVRYQVDSSPALGPPWEVIEEASFIVLPQGNGSETVIARDPSLPGVNTSGFLRLRVEPE